jgi:hypothetical protein
MEQLPQLIQTDASTTNPALLQIKEQLDEADAQKEQTVVWTGSVCASKYQTLSGSERIYYVCPYVVATTNPLSETESSDWTFSLQFAVSALKDKQLYSCDTNIQVNDILFTCRIGENAVILSEGYGDGEMNEVNGKSVSYQFRDRTYVNTDTNVFARLLLGAIHLEEGTFPESETATLNWSFQILEKNHVIGVFDDVQIEIPYLFSEERKEDD